MEETEIINNKADSMAVPEGVAFLFRAITGKVYEVQKGVSSRPAGITCIPRTNSKKELAEIYSAADVFVNPTHEDNYPTVNLEAAACGTRVITYDVGGAKETIKKDKAKEQIR